MAENWVKLDFQIEIRHVGFDVEFYDAEPADLPEFTKRLHEQNKDTARIFVQNRDGVAFSAAEMLAWYLKKQNTELTDHVPPNEIKPEGCEFTINFPINFTRDSFHMVTDEGPVDIKRLELAVRFFLEPTKH